MNWYVEQRKDYGIGNFINCTPTLKWLSDYYKEPIPVLFRSKHVADMFWDCSFIEEIKEPEIKGKELLFTSGLVNQNMPDYQYVFKSIVIDKLGINADLKHVPHTYVDKGEFKPDTNYIVIAYGGINNEFVDKKDPGPDIYVEIINKIKKIFPTFAPVFIGTPIDEKRINSVLERVGDGVHLVMKSVRFSLAIINACKFMISNDTGMYHAAGALEKDIFVIWKDTNLLKNTSPSENCFYAQKGTWSELIDVWLNDMGEKHGSN